MDIPKRSLRRHHYERLKAKAKKRWLKIWGNDDPKDGEYRYGFDAETPCTCSGPCCGNPRRHKKWVYNDTVYDQDGKKHKIALVHTVNKKDRITVQEQRSEIDFEDQLNEL